MKEKTCCFSGHRIIPREKKDEIIFNTKAAIMKLIELGITYFEAGGAIGYDTIAAQLVLDAKKRGLEIINTCTSPDSSFK